MATEPETYSPEILAEEEPRYLRRQKPPEIRRRKFGRRNWSFYRRWLVGGAFVVMGGWVLYQGLQFSLYSPRVLLIRSQQIDVVGNRVVDRVTVLERFKKDRGRSVLRVPLGERRRALEEIPWVEQAHVQRILPNRLRVVLVERTPVAFLRLGAELALVDAHGVILERPLRGDFRFPVVTGLSEAMPHEQREGRMKLYVEFVKQVELVHPAATDSVSEVNLADAKDVRAVLVGIPGARPGNSAGAGSLLVHFGESDFANKYRLLMENMDQWRAAAGRVDSVDLRFARQVVVNPEGRAAARAPGFDESGKPR